MNVLIPPHLFEIPLPQLEDAERVITKHAVDQYNNKHSQNVHKGYNVHLDPTPELDKLWRIFVRLCDTMFTNLDPVLEDIKFGESWAYVQNKDKNVSKWHTHVATASINGVYYPNIPDPTGTLSVLDIWNTEIKVPVKQGHLYLFPGWMLHKPNPQEYSIEPRVSINIELLTYSRPVLRDNVIKKNNIPHNTHPSFPKVMW